MNLIFLISQPRAGSTMAQAIISNHPEVASVSEPWLLLHLTTQIKSFTQSFAPYTDTDCRKVYCDLMQKVSETQRDKLVREFVESCYSYIADGTAYFLDKTPRYYLILEDIKRIFPEAKFIILKRNPLHVARSIKNTFWGNSSNLLPLALYHHHDLVKAPYMLQDFTDKYKKDSNVLSVKYENLVADSKSTFRDLFEWIGLSYSDDFLNYADNESYKGMFGDPASVMHHNSVQKRFHNTSPTAGYWKKFEQGYINYLGEDFLLKYGYGLDEVQVIPKATRSFDIFNEMGVKHCDKIHGWKRTMLDRLRFKFRNIFC